jgi:bacillithiol synthase
VTQTVNSVVSNAVGPSADTSGVPFANPVAAFQAGALREFHRLASGDLVGALEHSHSADRAALSAALEAYQVRLATSKPVLGPVLEAVKALAHPASRAVVTGQQAGLLGGPAYTFYKAISTIVLARQLSTPEAPVVPVFWVASQDHDAAEVRETWLLDLNEHEQHLQLPLPSGRPVGRISLEASWVAAILEALRNFKGQPEHQAWVIGLVEAAAKGSELGTAGTVSYADWFAKLISSILGPFGLVVFDPLEPGLAALFKPFLKDELERPLAGPEAIEVAAEKLEAQGFAAQLRRPPGSTNLFLECDDGERRLLKFDGTNFLADRTYTRADLERILEADPSRITPAAGLRPILADAVLPSAISVLGPSELAYQLELGGVYHLHGVAQPLLWPRLSVTWIEPPVKRILERYGLTAAAFMADPNGTLERLMLSRSGANEHLNTGLRDLEAAFATLEAGIAPLDETLLGALERSRARVLGHVQRLEGKIAKALVNREETSERQFGRLNTHLMPAGIPQERRTNFLSQLMKFGPVLLERLLALEATGSNQLEV